MEIKSWLVAVSIPSHIPRQIASDIQIEKRARQRSSTNKTLHLIKPVCLTIKLAKQTYPKKANDGKQTSSNVTKCISTTRYRLQNSQLSQESNIMENKSPPRW
jgi:hypothetical protein